MRALSIYDFVPSRPAVRVRLGGWLLMRPGASLNGVVVSGDSRHCPVEACDYRCSTVGVLALTAVFAACIQLLGSWRRVIWGCLPGCLLKSMCQLPRLRRVFNCWDIGGRCVCTDTSTVESRRIAQCCQRCLVLTFLPHSSQEVLRETRNFLQAVDGYIGHVSSYGWWRGSGGTP